MFRWVILLLSFLQVVSELSPAQTTPAPDTPEAGSVEAIAAATGDRRFLSPWVSYLPQSATVPSPLHFLGRIAGAPGEVQELVGIVGAAVDGKLQRGTRGDGGQGQVEGMFALVGGNFRRTQPAAE